MNLLVTRKIPEIILISADELSTSDLFYLNWKHKTDRSEFVVCDSRREKILVNKSLDFAENIIPLIDQIMERKYLDDGVTEKLLDTFSEIAGKKASDTLFYIWLKWREKRQEVELKENAEEIMNRIKKRRLKRYLRNRKETSRGIFSLGFGTYDEKSTCDFQKGSEHTFLYGYLCCLEDIENQRIKGYCKECG